MLYLTILFSLLIPSLNGGIYTQSGTQSQIDYYLSGISDGRSTPFNFWSLIKTAEVNRISERYVIERIIHHSDNNDLSNTTRCLIESFEIFQDKSPAENKIDRLHHAFGCTDDPEYLIVALYELNHADRLDWYNDHAGTFTSDVITPAQRALILKALGKTFSYSDLFLIRKFRLSDIYIFENYEHSNSVNLTSFLENWHTQISSLGRISQLPADLLASTLITAYFRLNDYDRIVEQFLSHSGFEAYPNIRNKLNTFRRVSYAAHFSGYYQTNLDLYRNHLIPFTQLIGDHQDVLIVQYEYGSSLFRLQNFTGALQQWEVVYNDSIGIQDNRYQSGLLNNLAVSYLFTGNFHQYIQLQIDALRKAEEVNDYLNQLFILNNLYIYHRRNSNSESAFSYLNQALNLSSDIQAPEEVATILRSLGTYYREVDNDYDRAIQNLYRAYAIADSTGSHRLKQSVNSEIALTYQRMEKFNEALQLYSELSAEAILRDDPSSYIDFITETTNILFTTNRLDEVSEMIEAIRSFDLMNVDFNLQVRSGNLLARYEMFNGNYKESLANLTAYAENILERTKNSADFQGGYVFMDSEYQQTFRLLTDVLLYLEKPDEAVVWLDEIKNISKASFYNNSLLKSNILTEEELLRDFVLSNRIERLRNELLSASSGERMNLNTQLIEAVNEKNRLKNKVMRNIAEEKLNLPQLQRHLGRNELVLSFSLFENQLYKSAISAGSIDIDSITFTDEEMQRVEFLIEGISNNNSDLQELYWLYTKLFDEPIHPRYNKLYVIPDGFLYRIPLETLPVAPVSSSFSFGSAKYMVESFSISYLNSILDLINHTERTPKLTHNRDFAGFGVSNFNRPVQSPYGTQELSPLPYAEIEVNEISSTITNLTNIVTKVGRESTERNFRNYAADSKILHVASHSEVFHNDPLFSLIYLNNEDGDTDPDNDGRIYAYELFELNLSNELVMLSSCESGSGSYIQGSGITGLSRAFTYAGAQSLVMNLWQIRDQTASEIAVSFYTYLNRGMNKDRAMQLAKLDYINNNNSDPYLWGSYVLYGDIRPLVHKKRYFTYMITGLILVVMFRFTVQAVQIEDN
ncbi:MAG: CHAT domain-containing protein [Balneolaceae bacterium]|nr:MAG: CHAT domain-containing protein [Balneolaceae bacterium]